MLYWTFGIAGLIQYFSFENLSSLASQDGLTLSALRGGENSPPYENSLSYFCEWVIFFQLLMTFQFETSNICWLGKIICLT